MEQFKELFLVTGLTLTLSIVVLYILGLIVERIVEFLGKKKRSNKEIIIILTESKSRRK